jgi:hypothetical protein
VFSVAAAAAVSRKIVRGGAGSERKAYPHIPPVTYHPESRFLPPPEFKLLNTNEK